MNKCYSIALFFLSVSFIGCEDSDDNCGKGTLIWFMAGEELNPFSQTSTSSQHQTMEPQPLL